MSEIGQIRIYGAGGCGINIASYFDSTAGKVEKGHASPCLTYIDTSKSNLASGINLDHVALIEEVDGSGKVRRENSDAINRNIRSILQQFQPTEFNVVVFSASGGSGSVLGPLIMAELLQRQCTVVGIVIGSDESNITAQNTVNTLKSLEAIAKRVDAPVVIHYSHNSKEMVRSEIDRECFRVIAALSLLSSKQNAELDSRDIGNWARFDRSTTAKPQLALFEVFYNRQDYEEDKDVPISVASLFNSTDALPLDKAPEYHCAGYPRNKIENHDEIHFAVSLDELHGVYRMIQERVSDLEQLRKSRVTHESIVKADEVDDSTGLVL